MVSIPKHVGRKREQNCFRCWHCRRVEGMSSCCVCVANMTKGTAPEFIEEPYGGTCLSFYDRQEEEHNILMGMDGIQ